MEGGKQVESLGHLGFAVTYGLMQSWPHVRGRMGKTPQFASWSASGHKTVQIKFLTRYGGKKNDLCL